MYVDVLVNEYFDDGSTRRATQQRQVETVNEARAWVFEQLQDMAGDGFQLSITVEETNYESDDDGMTYYYETTTVHVVDSRGDYRREVEYSFLVSVR